MNTKIRIQIAEIIVVMALGASLLSAASQSEGDYTVNAITVNGTVTEPGDLTVQGEAHIGGSLDLGTTGNSTSAILFHYSEVNADSSFSLAATKASTRSLTTATKKVGFFKYWRCDSMTNRKYLLHMPAR